MEKQKKTATDSTFYSATGLAEISLLLVEDSEADAYVTKRALTKHMKCECKIYHVSSFRDAASAIDEREKFDIILLDLGLPDTVSEVDTYSRINAVRKDIPVIVLTGFNDHDTAVRLVDTGAADYVKKSAIGSDPEILCDSIVFTLCREKKMRQLEEEKGKVAEQKDQFINWLSGGYSAS